MDLKRFLREEQAILRREQAKKRKNFLEEIRLEKKIEAFRKREFEEIKNLMDFKNRAQDYYRRWYIDGKIFFHKVIDMENPKDGIKDIRYIDPRKIRKVREVK